MIKLILKVFLHQILFTYFIYFAFVNLFVYVCVCKYVCKHMPCHTFQGERVNKVGVVHSFHCVSAEDGTQVLQPSLSAIIY